MPKTILPSIAEIQEAFKQFEFAQDEVFHWSPRANCVYYNQQLVKKEAGFFQLLHELSHALLGHTNFGSGVELLKMETAAWSKARELAESYNLEIKTEQIEQSLDSYRDWLYLRSICPSCNNVSVESEESKYHCFNCHQQWTVPRDQRARQYRLKQAATSK